MTPELLEVIRWNRKQAADAREMAARARAAGRDDGAVLAREQSALFHDQVADRAEELAKKEAAEPSSPSPKSSSEPESSRQGVKRSLVFLSGHLILDSDEKVQPTLEEVSARTSRALRDE